MKLSILMPVYNEEDTLCSIINKIDAVKLGMEKELIIVDDGSTDRSVKVVEEAQKVFPYIKFIQHEHNKGKGAAVRTARDVATGDFCIIQDADLEYDPEDYLKCLAPIMDDVADVVYGSRRLEKTNTQYSSIAFYFGGVLITTFFNLLYRTRLTDEPTCYKLFRREVFQAFSIDNDGFDWEPEVTAKVVRAGFKIFEVPIHYYPRKVEAGKKIKWKDGVTALWTMLKYRVCR